MGNSASHSAGLGVNWFSGFVDNQVGQNPVQGDPCKGIQYGSNPSVPPEKDGEVGSVNILAGIL